MHIMFQIFIWFLGTNTFKLMITKAIKWVVDKTTNTIDNEMAEVIISDIVRSKGNNLTREFLEDVKKELKSDTVKKSVDNFKEPALDDLESIEKSL